MNKKPENRSKEIENEPVAVIPDAPAKAVAAPEPEPVIILPHAAAKASQKTNTALVAELELVVEMAETQGLGGGWALDRLKAILAEYHSAE